MKSKVINGDIEDIIRRIVREEIAAFMGVAADTLFYASDGPLPPRTSRDTFNRVCRHGDVAGAERIAGRGFGYWRCTREAWHRARVRQPPTPTPREPTEEELAMRDLAAAGYRTTKTDVELADEMILASGDMNIQRLITVASDDAMRAIAEPRENQYVIVEGVGLYRYDDGAWHPVAMARTK